MSKGALVKTDRPTVDPTHWDRLLKEAAERQAAEEATHLVLIGRNRQEALEQCHAALGESIRVVNKLSNGGQLTTADLEALQRGAAAHNRLVSGGDVFAHANVEQETIDAVLEDYRKMRAARFLGMKEVERRVVRDQEGRIERVIERQILGS